MPVTPALPGRLGARARQSGNAAGWVRDCRPAPGATWGQAQPPRAMVLGASSLRLEGLPTGPGIPDTGALAAGEEHARPGRLRRAARRRAAGPWPSTPGEHWHPRGPTPGRWADLGPREGARSGCCRLAQDRHQLRWQADAAAIPSEAPYIRTKGSRGPLGRRRAEGSRLSACSGCA